MKSGKTILCTLGPASLNPRIIKRLAQTNVDLFRINLSHTKLEKIEEWVRLIRANSDVPICLDTQGAQVRTGLLEGTCVNLKSGTVVELVESPLHGKAATVPLYPASVLSQLMVGDLISIDYDKALLQVLEVQQGCRARVLSGGTVESNKAVVLDRSISLPPLTEADYTAIEIALRLGINQIAMSFTNCRSDVDLVRQLIGDQAHIIAKIESRLGLENLENILEVADAILIDRGDLSREIPLESLPFIQKDIIREANKACVPVYVATNLLESMVSNPRPTRAEVNDTINTLLDGADGLVLAAETAIGKDPVGCTRMVRRLIRSYEMSVQMPWSKTYLSSASCLVAPHGGRLINRVLAEVDHDALRKLPCLDIDEHVMIDAEQIAVGAFSPLEGFMGSEALECVLANHKLPDGTVWPMPILFQLCPTSRPVDVPNDTLALAFKGELWALLHVEECFTYDLDTLASKWFGTCDPAHPGVARLFSGTNCFVAGKVDLLPGALRHRQPYEFTPSQTRLIFEGFQWQTVVGFHTRNVAHRAHEYLQLSALNDDHCDGIFIHPVVGPKRSGDFSGDIILKSYQHLIENYYPPNRTLLGGFVSYSRYAGPREALFTALCRKNFGCSHFIVGRDHTGLGSYYSLDALPNFFSAVGDIDIQTIFFNEVYYCRQCMNYAEGCGHDVSFRERISGSLAREILRKGGALPEWYMRGDVSSLILQEIKSGNEVFVA